MWNGVFFVYLSHVSTNKFKGDRRLVFIDERVERFYRSVSRFHFKRYNLSVFFDYELKLRAISLLIIMEVISVFYEGFSFIVCFYRLIYYTVNVPFARSTAIKEIK